MAAIKNKWNPAKKMTLSKKRLCVRNEMEGIFMYREREKDIIFFSNTFF